MEGLIAHMRSLTLVGENFDYGENLTPNPP
jgi:hypothetical protein